MTKLRLTLAAPLVGLFGLAAPSAAQAQAGGPGFTFRQPTLSFGFHAGYARPFARSDLFDQTMDEVFLKLTRTSP